MKAERAATQFSSHTVTVTALTPTAITALHSKCITSFQTQCLCLAIIQESVHLRVQQGSCCTRSEPPTITCCTRTFQHSTAHQQCSGISFTKQRANIGISENASGFLKQLISSSLKLQHKRRQFALILRRKQYCIFGIRYAACTRPQCVEYCSFT